jgi:hypothetical protein
MRWQFLGAAACAALVIGCGGGGGGSSSIPGVNPPVTQPPPVTPPPVTPPGTQSASLKIMSPIAGAANASPDLAVAVQTTNFRIVSASSGPNVAGQGHLSYWMDTNPASNPSTPGAQQAFQSGFSVGGVVAPGAHTLFIELRNNDGTPLNPRVISQVAFTTPTIQFSQDVLRVFTNNGAKTCAQAGCHSGAFPAAGQNLEAANAYASIVNVASSEKPSLKRIQPGTGDSSYLYQKITGATGIVGSQMPLAGGTLADADVSKIELWIDQGALNN